MDKKYNIDTEEIQRILSLHEGYKKTLVNEQVASEVIKKNRQELIQFFANAKSYGCLTDPNLAYDAPYRLGTEDRSYIKGPSISMKGKDKRVYDDFTYAVVEPATGVILKSGPWSCPQLQPKKEEPKKEEPKKEGPKPLDSNQSKVLELIKPKGWFHDPAPTDVEVDQKLFEKMNLADVLTDLGKVYSKYFTNFVTPGFFVYRKITAQNPEQSKLGSKVVVTTESCKAAIESLYNNMKNQGTYPLSTEELTNYKTTAKLCAEPANSQKFMLRFGLKNKLKALGL